MNCLVELKDNCNKIENEIAFHPSFLIHFIICTCVEGVTKIVEH
jgi:hypothetical protein